LIDAPTDDQVGHGIGVDLRWRGAGQGRNGKTTDRQPPTLFEFHIIDL
jgi:hypothetical protein